jgi:hypothetical protein
MDVLQKPEAEFRPVLHDDRNSQSTKRPFKLYVNKKTVYNLIFMSIVATIMVLISIAMFQECYSHGMTNAVNGKYLQTGFFIRLQVVKEERITNFH